MQSNGFVTNIIGPAILLGLFSWQLYQTCMNLGLLAILPAEIFFLPMAMHVSNTLYVSFMNLLWYLLFVISPAGWIYAIYVTLNLPRIIITLLFSSVLSFSFLTYYFCVFLVTVRVIHSWRLFEGLLPSLFIIRWPRFRESSLSFGCIQGCRRVFESNLCAVCNALVDSSAVLTGTWWLFTKPTEMHLHYTDQELLESSKTCSLCYLLFNSRSSTTQNASSLNSNYVSTNDLESATDRSIVKIWKSSRVLEERTLCIQLIGSQFESEPLIVGVVDNGRICHVINA